MKNALKRHGQVLSIDDVSGELQKSHVQVPSPVFFTDDIIRVFYTSRDSFNQSRIFYFDFSISKNEVIYKNTVQVFDLGNIGAFDESGVMSSSIVDLGDGVYYLYYTGWSKRESVPYNNAIGLAVSKDHGESFERKFLGPVLGVSKYDPYFVGTANVLKQGNEWKCWYTTGLEYVYIEEKLEPIYSLKYANSSDGINWNPSNTICYEDYSKDYAIARAAVYTEKNEYKMFYDLRGLKDYRTNPEEAYTIRHGCSLEGLVWKDTNENIFQKSTFGWDAKMMSYPAIIENSSTRYIFYNGNDFGKYSIGLITVEK